MPFSFRHFEEWFRRTLLIALLFSAPAILIVRSQPMTDPDVWWHLRTGQWIVEHRALPTTDPFSSFGQGKPWVAYSWLFELLLYGLYRAFGLSGIIVYTISFVMAITAAIYALVSAGTYRLVHAAALTTCGLVALEPLMSPRPWLFTILFSALELNILRSVRRAGHTRLLYWLPPLFLIWANVHLQFVYGLFILAVAAIAPLGEQLLRRDFSWAGLASAFNKPLWLTLAGCALATLCTPHPLGLYQSLIAISRQAGVYRYISELQSIPFRSLMDWIVLLLTAGALFALGWRRETKLLPYLLLLAGLFLSFRAVRDLWFVVLIALWIISASPSTVARRREYNFISARTASTSAVVAVGLICAITLSRLSNAALEQQLAKRFPVSAAQFITERGYPGPIYNSFDWGGFLIWRLPQLPVSLDGRTNIYGDERIERAMRTWGGAHDWKADPELSAANVVIAPLDSPLASLLSCDSRFEKVFEDEVAVVYIRIGTK